MADTNDQTQTTGITGTTGTSATGNDQTDYKAEYMKLSAQIANGEYVPKNVYTGLQQTHEKTVLAHKADKDALNVHQTKISDLESTLKTLQEQSEQFKTNFETADQERTSLKTTVERNKLIMEKFPELAAFEAGGLLPQSPLDQLETVLQNFRDKVGVVQAQAKQQHVAGASEPPAGKSQQSPQQTSKALLDEANTLAREGKWTEYNQAMNKYYESIKN